MSWPDVSTDHASATFTRGADVLSVGSGGFAKVDGLLGLIGWGDYEMTDQPVAGVLGMTARRPTLGAFTLQRTLMIRGDVLATGGTAANEIRGMSANLHWLRQFFRPFTSGDGTYELELTVPGVGTYDGGVHLWCPIPDADLHSTFSPNLPLRITVPAGGLDFTEEP